MSTTTDAASTSSTVSSSTGRTTGANAGLVPMASARSRYRLDSGAPGLTTTSTDTTSPGETRKWRTSSWGRASAWARTETGIAASSMVNGAKVTLATLAGSTAAGSASSSKPFSSRATRIRSTGSDPRLASLAVTAARSAPAKVSRCTETPTTLTFCVSASSATATGVSTVPGGSRVFAALSMPVRWKSLTSTTSSRGRSESSRMPWASCRGGPKRVVAAPISASLTPARRLARSFVDRAPASAPLSNRTTVARSSGPRSWTTPRAAARARSHRSP